MTAAIRHENGGAPESATAVSAGSAGSIRVPDTTQSSALAFDAPEPSNSTRAFAVLPPLTPMEARALATFQLERFRLDFLARYRESGVEVA